MRTAAVLLLLLGASAAAVSAARVQSEAELTARQLRALQTSFSKHLDKEAKAKTAYEQTSFSKHLDKEAKAKTAYEPEPYYEEDEYYYKADKTESVCLREVYRRQCVRFGSGGPPQFNSTFVPAGRLQISDLGCCSDPVPLVPPTLAAGNKAKTSYYKEEEYGGPENDLVLPYQSGFLCNWEISYAEEPVNVSATVERIGAAQATCYFNHRAQKCSDALTPGTIITAKLDMFYVLSTASEAFGPNRGGLDDSCAAVYGGGAPPPPKPRTEPGVEALEGWLHESLKDKLKSDGVNVKPAYHYDGPTYHAEAPAPTLLGPGTAILLAGPITSIQNLKHDTEYKHGLLQFVPIWVDGARGFPTPGLEAAAAYLPKDSLSTIRPNSYKFVLSKGDY